VRSRVLVFGATGQVGREIVRQLDSLGSVDVLAASRSATDENLRFDLSDPPSVAGIINRIEAEYAIFAAAATNVRHCESHPDSTRIDNVDAPAAAAEACRSVGTKLTFISTDYVFDGRAGPYLEKDSPAPINAYGSQKLAAERCVLGASSQNLVVRTCQVFGSDPRRRNYVAGIADRLIAGEIVRAPHDLFGTPTYAPDLADAVIELTLGGKSGVWHVAGTSFVSRFELAQAIAAAFKLDGSRVVAMSADEIGDDVKRPRRAGLRSDLAVNLVAKGSPLEVSLAQFSKEEAVQ
jgi:dTDP-4-dehydrorhamnose reductase